MKLYAVIFIENGQEVIASDISANLAFTKAELMRRQSRDENGVYYVATFDQIEKLTPPVTDWTSEKVVIQQADSK